MVQNPAAAFRSSRLGANSSVRQKKRALSNPTNITRLTSWGLGTRLCGFHTRSFSNSRAVPELAASWVKKDQVVWRYCLGLLDINIPSRLSSWIRTPRSAVGVRSSNRMAMVGTSSLVTSQTKGSGTALEGIAARSRRSKALISSLSNTAFSRIYLSKDFSVFAQHSGFPSDHLGDPLCCFRGDLQ